MTLLMQWLTLTTILKIKKTREDYTQQVKKDTGAGEDKHGNNINNNRKGK